MQVFIRPATPFVPLTQDDIDDIHSLFQHTVHSFGDEQRDLRQASRRSCADQRNTFSLPSLFSGNIS